MNERLKELAEQAGIGKDFAISGLWLAEEEELERFAELIRQDEAQACAEHYLSIMRGAVEQAVLVEREACADLCEEQDEYGCGQYARAIRARGAA